MPPTVGMDWSCPSLRPEQEQCIERFEASWKNGTPPPLREFLPGGDQEPALQDRVQVLLELVKLDLEFRWRARARKTTDVPCHALEEYVAQHPELRQSPRFPLDLIAEEYRVRHRWGDRPTHNEYTRRFSEQEDALLTVLQQVDADLASEFSVSPEPRSTELGDTDASLESITALPRGHQGVAPSPSVAEVETTARLRILRRHAAGGLGQVSVAEDQELHRDVAFKEIKEDFADSPESRSRFLREAEITGSLEHPGIVPVYNLGTHKDGRPFYTMRFIKGDSLKEAIGKLHDPSRLADGTSQTPRRAAGPSYDSLEFRQLLGRFISVCNTIAYAHSRGVVHRDLKPGNIMLGNYGETLVVDWGLAKSGVGTASPAGSAGAESLLSAGAASGSAETLPGAALGTPAYMSPEQAAGNLDQIGPPSDVYSLGATLYHLLTGEPPFQEVDVGLMLAQVQVGDFHKPRNVKAGVPAALEAICLKAMALKLMDRYGSARELGEDIERWLGDEAVSAWVEPFVARSGRWVRRHKPLASGVAAAIAMGLIGLTASLLWLHDQQTRRALEDSARVAEETRKNNATHAAGLVKALASAKIGQVPTLVAEIGRYRTWADPLLKDELTAHNDHSQRKLNASIALLPVDSNQRSYLYARLLESTGEEFRVLRETLVSCKAELVDLLWAEVQTPSKGHEHHRVSAAAALAVYDSDNPRWAEITKQVVHDAVNPEYLGAWGDALAPAKEKFLEPLSVLFREHKGKQTTEGTLTTKLLADYAADRPEILVGLLMDADQEQFAILFPRVREHGEQAIALLSKEVSKHTTPFDNEAKEGIAYHQANAAVALLRMNQPEKVWPLLRHSPDPRVRSYLIHKFAPLRADAKSIARQLEVESDVVIKQALILSLGDFSDKQLPTDLRATATIALKDIYRNSMNPGLHASAEWLLRSWNQREFLVQLNDQWRRDEKRRQNQLNSIVTTLSADKAEPLWYVDGQGHTMVVIPGPVEFLMGSPAAEVGRDTDEIQHKKRIPRTFALGAKSVTIDQYRKFARMYTEPNAPDLPALGITWYQAAAYCNWLSKQERIPVGEWCYETHANGQVAQLKKNYLSLAGYRLPTEAEMEYCTRAGSLTSRYFGDSEDLLPKYAWYAQNSHGQTWPVGTLRPNTLGFFDMHGNVYTWCQERHRRYPTTNLDQSTVDDVEDDLFIDDNIGRVVRGGSIRFPAQTIRSAFRGSVVPTLQTSFPGFGFRVARSFVGPMKGSPTSPVLPDPKPIAFSLLFNGKDLSGWQPHPYWRVVDGIICGLIPNPSPLVTTRDDFMDFHLRVEARVMTKGGVHFRCPIRNGASEGYRVTMGFPPGKVRLTRQFRTGETSSASSALGQDTALPGGEWMILEIIARDSRLTIVVNGKTVTDVVDDKRASARGHIALEGGSDSCQFRKIEIREFRSADAK